MKTRSGLVAMLFVASFAVMEVSGQCEPDTINCKDTDDPGEICPRNLPEATVDVPYDETITVLAPASFELGDYGEIQVAYIIVDSVLNLPPGISYWASAEKFHPDTAYCIQVSGIPEQTGEFQLSIYVTPFIYLGQITQGPQIVDDTSVMMTVHGPSGIDPFKVNDFRVLPTVPNPFSEVTRIGFYTPFDDRINLKVFNILGEMMYEETQGAPPGEHYFEFNGSALLPGTYFYRVTNSSQLYTGKFIKSR